MLLAQAQQVGLEPLRLPSLAYRDVLPMIILTAGAMGLLLLASLVPGKRGRGFYAGVTVATAVASLVSSWSLWSGLDDPGPRFAFSNSVVTAAHSSPISARAASSS